MLADSKTFRPRGIAPGTELPLGIFKVSILKFRAGPAFEVVFHWSGKEIALRPPPPLRTGRESFPSSGSSNYKAPRERSRFHNGLVLACLHARPNFFWNARFKK